MGVRSEEEIRNQLNLARQELETIRKNVPPGSCAWSAQKCYINGLLYALGEE